MRSMSTNVVGTPVKVAVSDWSQFRYTTRDAYIQQYCAYGATSNAVKHQKITIFYMTMLLPSTSICSTRGEKLVLTTKLSTL